MAELDVVIIGAGLAGLTVALHLAETQPVIVLAKRQLEEAATAWAQGGIVGVLGSDDSIESHVRDTQEAGAGLVDERTAEFIARHSAEAVEWLVARGVPFSPDPEGPLGLHLTREGGHAVRRIAHAADATGKAIHDALLDKARAHPNIELRQRWMALDLITSRHVQREDVDRGVPRVYGVYALDIDAQRVETLPARAVTLANTHVGRYLVVLSLFHAKGMIIPCLLATYNGGTQTLLQRKPKTYEVRVDGRLAPGVSSKDIILNLIARIGVGGGTGHVFEYTGEAIRSLEMPGSEMPGVPASVTSATERPASEKSGNCSPRYDASAQTSGSTRCWRVLPPCTWPVCPRWSSTSGPGGCPRTASSRTASWAACWPGRTWPRAARSVPPGSVRSSCPTTYRHRRASATSCTG